jgi:hypothetical protein
MPFAILGTPKPQFFDSSGSPLASGTLTIVDPDTDVNKATYTTYANADSLGTTNSNPITLDSRGEPSSELWGLDNEDYKLTLKDSNGDTVWTVDKLIAPVEINATTSAETTAGVTPSDYSYPPLNVLRYGADPTGTADSTAAIQAAIDTAEAANVINYAGGGRVHIPAGTYWIASTLNLGRNKLCQIVGDGQLITSLSYTGSGVAIDLAGTTSGDNQSFYMADLQISNDASKGTMLGDGTGTTGFEGNFMGFSPTFERVLIKGFTTYNWWLENFENGAFIQTRDEGIANTATGVYLKNANNVMFLGHQSHGPGSRSGNDPTNTFHTNYTGSVCVYANNIEACSFTSCSFEGAATNTDVGLWLEEDADRATPRGGAVISSCYFERVDTGIVLRGFDSDTELTNTTIIGGKISGSVSRGIIGSNYVENVLMDSMEVQATQGSHLVFDSTCKNIRIGSNMSYQNLPTGGDSSVFPGIHNGINFVEGNGVEGTVEVYDGSNLTADVATVSDTFVDGNVTTGTDRITVTATPLRTGMKVQLTTGGTLPAGLALATDYYVKLIDANTIELYSDSNRINIVDITAAAGGGTHTITTDNPPSYYPPVIATDYRRVRACIFNVKITVNVSGSSGRVSVKLLPTDEGNDSSIFMTVDSSVVAQTTPYTQQFIIPVDGATGGITWDVFVTPSVSWDVDVNITQVGVII